jgi:hypothetical protein
MGASNTIFTLEYKHREAHPTVNFLSPPVNIYTTKSAPTAGSTPLDRFPLGASHNPNHSSLAVKFEGTLCPTPVA